MAPEGAQLEFKTATNTFHFEKLAEYCVALANEGGGKIIFGVTDKRPRNVVGTLAFDEPGRTESGLHTWLGHTIPIEENHYQGKRLLIVHVPGRLPGAPWQIKGRYLRRAGDELTHMDENDLRKIYAEVDPDYSAQTCEATFTDLSQKAVREFRQRWYRKTSNDHILNCTDEQLLADAELLVSGRPNIAALILFGTHEALGRHLGQAEIIFEYRSSEASGPAQDRIEFREGFFLCYEALWQRINLRNDLQSYQEGLFRYDIPTFDEVAVREALLNAIAHRNYRLSGSIFLRQFARRLEVISPADFRWALHPRIFWINKTRGIGD